MRSAPAIAMVLHLGMAGLSFGQASEVLDARDLGDRGVVFESAVTESSVMTNLVGLGDTDGDGLDDVALAFRRTEQGDPSVVHLIKGRAGLVGRHTVPGALPGMTTFRAAGTPDAFLSMEGPVGDLDGDGLAEVFVGLIDYAVLHETHYAGGNYLLYGTRELEGAHDLDEIGNSLRGVVFRSEDPHIGWCSAANVGDFDGDGKNDLALGASTATNARGQVNAGIVFVLFDPANLPPIVDLLEVGRSLPGVQIHGNPTPGFHDEFIGNLGREIRSVGDFDGDGLGDLLVNEGEAWPRALYLIRGRRGLTTILELADAATLENVTVFRGNPRGFHPGGFAGVGDFDGDGLGEIALGTPRYSYGPFVPGYSVVNLIRGGTDLSPEVDRIPSPVLEVSATVFHSPGDIDQFGMTVEPAGDMNADGIPDFVTAATWASPRGKDKAGEAYVIFGRPDLERDVRLADGYDGIQVLGEGTDNYLGNEASPAGDFNGDGADDLLLLAPQLGTAPDRSRAYLIYGTGSGPVPLRLYRAEPAAGGLRGGTAVKLRGSGFTGIAGDVQVFFGANPVSGAGVISGSEIRVETPPGERTGVVDVTLVIGAETRTISAGFEYTPDYPPIDLADLGAGGLVLEGERMVEGDASPGSSASFGDLTGDGIDELAVGSQTPRGGTVTLVRGGPGLPARLPAFTSSDRVSLITGFEMPADAPVHVAMLGDVDGDGMGDLGIGLPAGIAYILFGRAFPPELLLEEELFERRAARLEAPGDVSDVQLAGLGDTTGDGIADFAVALPRASQGLGEAGEIVVVAGRRVWPEDLYLDLPASAHARVRGSRSGERLGEEIAPAGDFNGDGAIDFMAGTRGGAGSGSAYVIHGGVVLAGDLDVESLVLAGKAVQIDIEDGFARFDWLHVAPAGDTDGDGFDDVLLGVEDGGESNQGVTYLVRGRSLVPEPLKLVEEPAEPDGVTRFFGAAPRVQSGRVAPAGDFNADGLDDFLIAELPEKPLAAYPWKVRLVLGSAGLPQAVDLSAAASLALELPGPHAAQVFLPAREAGDLNGDGQPDFAITEGFRPFEDSPGSVYVVFGAFGGTTFRRGDANFDDRIEISDAIFTLAYLFLGGEAPRCANAVDADDDGQLVLTDAVYTLNHLFGGGPEPPAPYPGPGEDPTADGLDCRGF